MSTSPTDAFASGPPVVPTSACGIPRTSPHSGETVRTAEFTDVQAPGQYVLALSGRELSHPFRIAPNVHGEAAEATLKGFYFQRASTSLHRKWAAQWGRAAGHPDDSVRVHPSAASETRPGGSLIAAPGGWYDAGDYNKYVVNSGISTATLLALYEEFPAHLDTLETDIPESTSDLPDVLDEALWNVRWMLAMQDPGDGGVYHKLTTPSFSGAVMPADAVGMRYVVKKSTAATLGFAAVMAQASRIFERFPGALPGLSYSSRTAAEPAWDWARRNPHRIYDQDRLNEQFDPDVETGAYGDTDLDDERAWAAAELYATTGRDSFFQAVSLPQGSSVPLPSWSQVRTLGYYSLLRNRATLDPAADEKLDRIEARVLRYADGLAAHADTSAYGTPMGRRTGNFVWGSNSVAANQGVALIQAHRLTSNPVYLDGALANLDYLLGRNATGYSFLTGHGDNTPRHPHHRPSRADAIPEPVPGLLVGGPNPGQQDGCTYPSDLPARAYVDDWCSYASNEIAINWNAPMAYLTVAVEALQRERN
jgi:endoglucanase